MHHPQLEELADHDPRYAYEAYEFLFEALAHTQIMLGRVPEEHDEEDEEDDLEVQPSYHVSGPELLEGVRDLALKQFGMLARTVFRMWGINKTKDIGNIVFNLIEAGLMSRTDQDNLDDFDNVYDMDKALIHEIIMDEAD